MTFYKLMSLIAVAAVVSAPCLGSARYYNVSNAPFATVSNGPQNAVVVHVANPKNSNEVKAAVSAGIGRPSRAATVSPVTRQIVALRKLGLIRPNVDPKVYGMIMIESGGSIVPRSRGPVTYGGGEITFTYTGWSAGDEDLLRRFAAIAYPIVKQMYGKPARTITVNVFNDTALGDKDSLLGGVYVTGSGTAPQIRLRTSSSDVTLERGFLHMMLRAFHDTAAFSYDAWEEGFDRAAAVVAGEAIDGVIVATNPPPPPLRPLQPVDFVGSGAFGSDAFYYVMSNYEVLNQPPLSNNMFFTSFADQLASQVDNLGGMIIPRLGMSSTAWLKVYTERLLADGKSFFQLFNDAYYLQLSGNASLPGNVPALKTIASSFAPNVEGQPFEQWFRKQYIFDTSISIGAKLYAQAYPPSVLAPEGDYTLPTFLIYYQTSPTGDETPLSGTVYPVYWNYLYKTDIPPASSQYEQFTIANGQGDALTAFFVDTIGGAQRIAIDYTAGTETVRVYFPAGMAGTAASPNNFLGSVVGSDTGSVNVKVGNQAVGTTTAVTSGAFGTAFPSISSFTKLTITLTLADSSKVTRTVNVGPGSYQTIIQTATVPTTLQHVFLPGFRMISVPMTTFAQDQAQAMADQSGNPVIPAQSLLLARWDPLVTDTYKYEMYPTAPPFAPGRGYWVKFPSSTIANFTGQTPDSTAMYRIGLVNGWNQIGGPFTKSVAISSLLVEKGNDEPIPFANAWSQGLIGKVIWKYAPGTGYAEATSLDPWEGYWVKCNVAAGAVLIVPGPDSKSRSRSASGAVVR